MRLLLRLLLLFLGFMFVAMLTYAQSTSNKGTEFYTAYMDHVNGAGTTANASAMSVYITSDVSTSGQVDIADGSSSQPFNVVANQVTIINIPASAFLDDVSGVITSKGIHITSLKPVAVYAHIYANSVSGATLLLPVNTLGKDYQSINYIQKSNATAAKPAYSAFVVVATEDNTTVEITPSATLKSGEGAGVKYTITLNKGQVYQGLSQVDLTGTHIKSISANGLACKRIAVFSGSSKISIGACSTRITSDNLFQQVYPTASWGKNYVTAPLASRSYDVFRIIVSDPAATITLNGAVIPAASYSSGFYEFNSTTPNVITSDKPIQVVQYAVTQGTTLNCTGGNSDIGDPEMIYLNPIEQGLDHVTLYSSPFYRILSSFINVIIPTTAASSFKLDGTTYGAFAVVPGSAYSYAQIPVSNGPHTITASQTFNAIAYGFGSVESYGYAAGTDLRNLNEFIALQQPGSSNNLQSNGCSDISYDLKVTLPYTTNSITWDFRDGTTPVEQTNPVAATSTDSNGQPIYTYTYTKKVQYKKGDYTIIATVFNATADECGNNETIEFDFSVVDPPQVGFTYGNSCLGQSSAFNYIATADSAGIKSYNWDFGDGTTSALQSPTHTYATSGDYNVVLTVINTSDCSTVSPAQVVHISKKPVAQFIIAQPDCAGVAVAFTNQSTDPEGNLPLIYTWDFGDGTPVSTDPNPSHPFVLTGTYHVKLVVVNSKGCASDTLDRVITINPLPVANFDTPDVCLNDVSANFTNTSSIADHTESDFTYSWNFNDPNANAVNNTSTLANPSHRYRASGKYQVSLVITSKYGCTSTVTKEITVNQSFPHTDFTVENAGNLCSASTVFFDDKTTTAGTDVITKVIWHWDVNNNPGAVSVYDNSQIPSDGKYMHDYVFPYTDALKKNYDVLLEEFTGATCVDRKTVTITVYANPVITLTAPTVICQEASPVNIIEVKNGFAGTGVFTGTGVTTSGIFDPLKAGPGSFTIHYIFTDEVTTCQYITDIPITVNPTPKADAGPDHTFLEGSAVTLEATASTTSATNTLKYKWTPATGLDHDDVLNPVANPIDNTKYTLTVTSVPDGCSVSSTTSVYVLKLPIIPNTFTPNNDGYNDFWNIKYLADYKDATVEVFTRNGEKVFSSVGYNIPWDGRYNGNDLPVGVYYYIVNPKHSRKTMAGYVTILK